MWEQEPHSLIAKQLRDAWRIGGHPSLLFGRAIKELCRIKPIDGVFVCEFSSADLETPRCTGDLVQTWFHAGDEFEEVEMPERIEQPSAIWTPTPIISFHFRESEGDFVITWFSGERAGHGCKYKIVENHSYRTLEPYGNSWNS